MSKKEVNKKRSKKKIFLIVILIVLVSLLVFFVYRFISNKIDEANTKKFSGIINEVSKERTDYVFVEINPSFVLTVKNGNVIDVACLNDDCVSIYNDIDVKGKNLNDSIDNLYNTSKEKGFDTSNGVKVKTSDNVSIESKDYITIEYIDATKEKELLNEVKNNEEIKNVSNGDYYSKLWEELKKDSDYGEVYTCNMDNEELECHIKEDFIIYDGGDTDDYEKAIEIWKANLSPNFNKIARVLKKFGINVKSNDELIANPIGIITVNGKEFTGGLYGSTAEKYVYDSKIYCDIYEIYLTDIDLLKPNNIPMKILLEEGEFNPNTNDGVEEWIDNYCNEWKCYKTIRRTQWYCDYNEEEGYGNWNTRSMPSITQECDLNYQNCKYIES